MSRYICVRFSLTLNVASLARVIFLITVAAQCSYGQSQITVDYDPGTGAVSLSSRSTNAELFAFELISPARLFDEDAEPLVPLGHYHSGSVYYLAPSRDPANQDVELGQLLPTGLDVGQLQEEFCVKQASVRHADSWNTVTVDQVLLNGNLLTEEIGNCPHVPFLFEHPSPVEPIALLSYDAQTGEMDVRAIEAGNATQGATMTALQIKSRSGIFTGAPAQGIGDTPFDIDRDHLLFKLAHAGFSEIALGAVASPGLTNNEVHSDLCVSGAWAPSGRLDAFFAYPEGEYVPIPRCTTTAHSPPDTRIDLKYAQKDGSLVIESGPMVGVEIKSKSGVFTGGVANGLDGVFDRQTAFKIKKHDAAGFEVLDLGSVVAPGLSEEFLAEDLTVDAVYLDSSRIRSVNVIAVPEPSACCLVTIGLMLRLVFRKRSAADGYFL